MDLLGGAAGWGLTWAQQPDPINGARPFVSNTLIGGTIAGSVATAAQGKNMSSAGFGFNVGLDVMGARAAVTTRQIEQGKREDMTPAEIAKDAAKVGVPAGVAGGLLHFAARKVSGSPMLAPVSRFLTKTHLTITPRAFWGVFRW